MLNTLERHLIDQAATFGSKAWYAAVKQPKGYWRKTERDFIGLAMEVAFEVASEWQAEISKYEQKEIGL